MWAWWSYPSALAKVWRFDSGGTESNAVRCISQQLQFSAILIKHFFPSITNYRLLDVMAGNNTWICLKFWPRLASCLRDEALLWKLHQVFFSRAWLAWAKLCISLPLDLCTPLRIHCSSCRGRAYTLYIFFGYVVWSRAQFNLRTSVKWMKAQRDSHFTITAFKRWQQIIGCGSATCGWQHRQSMAGGVGTSSFNLQQKHACWMAITPMSCH